MNLQDKIGLVTDFFCEVIRLPNVRLHRIMSSVVEADERKNRLKLVADCCLTYGLNKGDFHYGELETEPHLQNLFRQRDRCF